MRAGDENIDAVVFYAAWFETVDAAASGKPWLAAGASMLALAINIALTHRRSTEVKLILAAALLGLIVDGLLMTSGFARYAAPGPLSGVPPAWLILMWMAFATTLNQSLSWLEDRPGLAAVLGLIGGAASYYAGARFGAMEFSQPLWLALGAVGVLWTAALPVLFYLARHLNSGEPASAADT